MVTVDAHPRPPRRSLLAAGAVLPLTSAALAGCGDDQDDPGSAPELQAEVPRADADAPEGAGDPMVPFTARLLGAIDRETVNAVCSPLSAQVALTMAGLGAAGDTRAQMEQVLGGSIDELAQNANTLAQVLADVGEEEREADDDDSPEPPTASLVNGTWLHEGMSVEEPFLEDLATYFGSGVHQVDFEDEAAREQGREEINAWVAEATRDLIENLIPEGVLAEDTRFVLVNALHLKAAWNAPLTVADGPFTTSDGEELTAEMLSGTTSSWYEDELCRAAALDTYGDDLALALVRPDEDVATVLDAWAETADDPESGLGALLHGLTEGDATTELTLPSFDIDWDASLVPSLRELGMDAVFDDADFSGITEETQLVISDVLQKAVITVDEDGMEAAAATAAVGEAVSAPVEVRELVLDAPFLFIAYETSTLAPLVLGWIGDPSRTR